MAGEEEGKGEGVSGAVLGLLVASGISAAVLLALFVLLLLRAARGVSKLLRPKDGGSKGGKPRGGKGSQHQQQQQPPPPAAPQQANGARERAPTIKSLIQEQKKQKGAPKDDHASGHALFLSTLKGHGDAVHSAAWSTDGMQVITACEDMLVRVFEMQDVTNRDPKFRRCKTARIPVGAGFSDSPGHVVVLMKGINSAVLAAYGPSENAAEGGAYEQKWMVDSAHGKELPLGVCVIPSSAACKGRGVVVSCSTKKEARAFNLQGRELAVMDPNSLLNHSLVVSRDGRFVAVACFTSELRLWELKWATTGEFRGAFKAMELKGHKSQVLCAAISADNKRAATASKDGTLRVWNIDVRYELEEDPKTTLVIAMPLPQGRVYQHLELGPNNVLAASYEGMVHLLSATTGELLESIDAHDAQITSMAWCPRKVKSPGSPAPHAVLATSSLDKRVRLWRWP